MLIKVNNYKRYLIEHYNHLIDSTDLKKKERLVLLGIQYPDSKIKEIIDNSYAFVKDILSADTADNGYVSFYLEGDTRQPLSLGLIGGQPSDMLYVDHKGRLISEFVVKQAFRTNDLYMDIIMDELPMTTSAMENDFELYNYMYRLYIEGLPKDLSNFRSYYFGEHTEYNQLVRDNVPEQLIAEGQQVEARTLNDDEYITSLFKLLQSKGREISAATSKEEVLDVLGDISDVSSAVAEHYGFSLKDVLNAASEKTAKDGGYQKKTFLESTVKRHN